MVLRFVFYCKLCNVDQHYCKFEFYLMKLGIKCNSRSQGAQIELYLPLELPY